MAKAPTQIRSLARSHTETALNVLSSIMNKSDAPESARVSAATAILDRGWGKPTQPIAGDDEHDPLRIQQIERRIVDPANTDSESVPPTT